MYKVFPIAFQAQKVLKAAYLDGNIILRGSVLKYCYFL